MKSLPGMILLAALACAGAAEPFEKIGGAFLEKHCTACHGAKKQKGEIALHHYRDDASLLKNRKQWKAILQAVEQRDMPPDDEPQPTDAERAAFVASAKAVFSNFDRDAKPDPGRTTLRRLNRVEYNNTIRDLTGVDFEPAADFPADDVGHGFDNIADVLSLSPVLMERYLDAAQNVAAAALPDSLPPPNKRHMSARFTEPAAAQVPLRGEWRFISPGKDNLGTGPLNTPFSPSSAGGDYILRTRVYAESPSGRPVKIALLAAGDEIENPQDLSALEADKVGQVRRSRILHTAEITARSEKDAQVIEAKLPAIRGTTRVAIALVRDGAANPPPTVFVRFLEVEGPLQDGTPFMRRWMKGVKPGGPHEQAREILTFFTSRAWRRPVLDDEMHRVFALADAALARGANLHAAVREAVAAVLSSPKFIFRAEPDSEPGNKEPHPITEFQLATRLSYFLWSTMPDEELFRLAGERKLTASLDAQVRRMLKDPRATALVDNFAMQWLQLRRLAIHQADPGTFKRWRGGLRASMEKETQLFIQEIVRDDRSILDLLDADFTYLDRRLGELYQLQPSGGFQGDQFKRVSLAGTQRGGLLTHASILTVTSNPTRTSPVKRGKWILEQILGTPPPPAPPDVPSLDDANRRELTGTFREKLIQHRADPKCGGCHAKMDTFGFALENFDGIGRWRDRDETGRPLEIGGSAPGIEIASLAALKDYLKNNREPFARCLTEKMLTYALGRGVEYYDERSVEKILRDLPAAGWKFSALVAGVVKSEPFRLRRGAAGAGH